MKIEPEIQGYLLRFIGKDANGIPLVVFELSSPAVINGFWIMNCMNELEVKEAKLSA